MTREEFQKLVERHQGLNGDPVVLDPKIKQKDRYGEEAEVPNPNPRRRYVFNDGTSIEGTTTDDGGVNVTNAGTALKPPAKPASEKPSALSAPPTQKYIITVDANGKQTQTENPNYVPPKGETVPTGRYVPTGPEGQTMPERLSPAAYNALIAGERQKAQARLDEIKIAEAQGKLDHAEADRQRAINQQEFENRLAEARARREADDQAIKRENAALANKREDRLTNADTRNAATAERKQLFDETKFGYDAGQDAVATALKMSPLRLGNGLGFAEDYARGLSTLSSGGGPISFRPESLMSPAVDLSALAADASRRAVAQLHGGVHPLDAAAPTAPVAPNAVAPPPPGDPAYQPPIGPYTGALARPLPEGRFGP